MFADNTRSMKFCPVGGPRSSPFSLPEGFCAVWGAHIEPEVLAGFQSQESQKVNISEFLFQLVYWMILLMLLLGHLLDNNTILNVYVYLNDANIFVHCWEAWQSNESELRSKR